MSSAPGPVSDADEPSAPRLPLTVVDRGVMLEVRVQPGARRNEVVGRHGDALKVRVAAPAVEGRANDELVAFLAKTFRVRRSKVAISFGSTGRRKRIVIEGADVATVSAVLDRIVR